MTTGATAADAGLYCGIDLGAAATKLVLLDGAAVLRAALVLPSGLDYTRTAEEALARLLAAAGAYPDQLSAAVATGYGRQRVPFAGQTATEILCHAKGCFHHLGRAITIVDLGGQDSKVIHLDAGGARLGFKMNRKCAAGTGAFLEELALRLGLALEELEPLAAGASAAAPLSSFCTVFAKTEILTHLRLGVPVEQLVRGAFVAVVQRVRELDPLEGEVVLTGGVVAHNPTVARLLAQALGRPVTVPPSPQLTGALGAALLARAQVQAPSPQESAHA